jgi:hypothetical protein
MRHNVFTFFSQHNCLDEDFDAADAAADRELVRSIVAGHAGMHPEAWDSRSALTAVMPQGFHGHEWVPPDYRPPIARSTLAVKENAERKRRDAEWEAKHRQRQVEQPKPEPHRRKWKPPPPEITDGPPMASGDMQLTCDDCGKRKFKSSIYHHGGPVPSDKQGRLWELAREAGWLIFAGRDLCPKCALATVVYACAILKRQTEPIVER